MSQGRLVVLAAIVALALVFFGFDLPQYLTLDTLKSQQANLSGWIESNWLIAVTAFFMIYVAVAALSLPGAAVMTLGAGALFGLGWGALIVSFASSLGATLAFLASRYLFRESLQKRYQDRLARIDGGVRREGPFYLASLRLVPVFPFFVINLLMGLTGMRVWTFYWVSQLAMLPGTLVYVNAGTQLAQISEVGDVLSPALWVSFLLLATFPLLAKWGFAKLNQHRLYKGFTKPASFDFNLLVIGAGSAGLVSSYIGVAVKAKVALIEKHKMGGDCLNTGCVPSKALIRSGKVVQTVREAEQFGLDPVEPSVRFAKVMERVQAIVRQVEPHDSIERYTELGVECITGSAQLLTPWEVEVEDADGLTRRITAKAIILATGGRPFVPSIKGLEQINVLTSDNLWELREQPRRLLVLGGGPIGCELSQAFARLGSQVIQVEQGDRLLPREDQDVSEAILAKFQQEGVEVRLEHEAVELLLERESKILLCRHQGTLVRFEFDEVIVAVGRKANTANLGLERLGIEPTSRGTLPTADDLSVKYPNIFACGDVAGPYQFTHTAAHQAWYAAVNGLFGGLRSFKVDYSIIPWVTFTAPEVARVGLSEAEAREQGIAYEVTRYGLDDLDRAIAEGEAHGFIKVLTPPGKDRILGVTIVGAHAGELLAEFVLAMKHGLGLNKILGTIHAYPTWNDAVKNTAGHWKKSHTPERLLNWVQRFHQWRLS